MKPKVMSGAEFKLHFSELLAVLKDEDAVYFGSGDLSFSAVKNSSPLDGPRLMQIEFNEVYSVVRD